MTSVERTDRPRARAPAAARGATGAWRVAACLVVGSAVAIAAASARPQRADEWALVEPGIELLYPRDHASHPVTATEWWYVTGHLATETGERYGFQFTVFRQGIDATPPAEGESSLRARQVYAAHLALADPALGRLRLAERMRREDPLANAARDDMRLTLEDWSMRRDADDRVHIDARDPAAGFGLALALVPTKPLVLHGERGYSRKGPEPGNASAYASWTRLTVEGTLALGERELAVRGQAWFDHEFGSGQLSSGVEGWDWFSLQLDDGRDVMLYSLRGADGRPSASSAGTLVERDGSAIHLARDDFAIEALSTWTSPRNGARYPSGWRLRVPAHAIDVRAQPVLADCELDASRSSGVVYWEGPIRLEGTHAGLGFAELTGYAGTLAERF